MNRMIQSAGLWWDGRSVREQRMLAVMGALVLGVVGWLGVVRPLDGWQADQARARRCVQAHAGIVAGFVIGFVLHGEGEDRDAFCRIRIHVFQQVA